MGDIIDKRKSSAGWSSSVSTSMKIEMGSILITENVLKVKKKDVAGCKYKKDGLLR